LNDFIKKTFNVNDDKKEGANTNPDYNLGLYDCRHFTNQIKEQLKKIIEEDNIEPKSIKSQKPKPKNDKKRQRR